MVKKRVGPKLWGPRTTSGVRADVRKQAEFTSAVKRGGRRASPADRTACPELTGGGGTRAAENVTPDDVRSPRRRPQAGGIHFRR